MSNKQLSVKESPAVSVAQIQPDSKNETRRMSAKKLQLLNEMSKKGILPLSDRIELSKVQAERAEDTSQNDLDCNEEDDDEEPRPNFFD